MVETCVNDDGETDCEKDGGGENEKRKGSVRINIVRVPGRMNHRTCGRNGATDGGWEREGKQER